MRVARTAAQLRSCLSRARYPHLSPNYYRASCRGLATFPPPSDESGVTDAISGPVRKLLDPIVDAPESVVAAAPVAAKIADDAFTSKSNAAASVSGNESFASGAENVAPAFTSSPGDPAQSATALPKSSDSFVNVPEPVSATTSGTATADAAGAGATAVDGATLIDAATVVDPTTSAQAAEAAASAGFSLSDTLLQPTLMLLHGVHDFSGLPWWLSIGLATFAVRTAIMPITLMTVRNSAKMSALQPELALRREGVMEAMRSGDNSKAVKRQEAMKKFLRDAGVGPSKVLLGPLAQFPIFISFFVGVRRLAINEPTMTTGGAAWFSDLSAADPTFALPIFCGLSLAAMTELGGDTGQTKITPMMKKGLRMMAVLSVPLTYWFPAGVFCYWLPNNLYSVLFTTAIRTETMKKRIGMNVDLSKIPGTKEHAQATKQFSMAPPVDGERLNAAKAAASYVKNVEATGVDIPEVLGSGDGRKPVLLKHRPKKKRRAHN